LRALEDPRARQNLEIAQDFGIKSPDQVPDWMEYVEEVVLPGLENAQPGDTLGDVLSDQEIADLVPSEDVSLFDEPSYERSPEVEQALNDPDIEDVPVDAATNRLLELLRNQAK
jgi:hypothetical protein